MLKLTFAVAVSLAAGVLAGGAGPSVRATTITGTRGAAPEARPPALIVRTARPLQDDWDDALAAALAAYNGVARSRGESCSDDNPGGQTCLFADRTPEAVETARRGIFTFGIGDPGGFGGAFIIWGRTAGGAWQQWFGTQNLLYQPLVLPGEARVCADGDGLNVRDAPSTQANLLTLVPDGTLLTAEEFVLTQPQPLDDQGRPTGRGDGWYRISGPAAGWVNYRYISSTRLPDCSVRDAFEHR